MSTPARTYLARHGQDVAAAVQRAFTAAYSAAADDPIAFLALHLLQHELSASQRKAVLAKASLISMAVPTPREEREAAAARLEVEREEHARACTFHFLDAAFVRTATALPSFQDAPPGTLVRRTITSVEAYHGAWEAGDLLVVSHRWERPEAPDGTGVQLRALQAHLATHPEVRGVWFDYSCMPQGGRTPAQQVLFNHMLRNVNLLYLGLPALLLVDISYLSRFW
jgi:hypothetical protein